MKKNSLTRVLSVILCALLCAAAAVCITGCSAKNETTPTVEAENTSAESAGNTEAEQIGEGSVSFTLNVVDADGNEKVFNVSTDEKTVGDALQNLGLIEGEEGPYGLYIKTVDGKTADYDTDGTYWAFYVDGAYATGGVDTTEIVAGQEYMLKIEK